MPFYRIFLTSSLASAGREVVVARSYAQLLRPSSLVDRLILRLIRCTSTTSHEQQDHRRNKIQQRNRRKKSQSVLPNGGTKKMIVIDGAAGSVHGQ